MDSTVRLAVCGHWALFRQSLSCPTSPLSQFLVWRSPQHHALVQHGALSVEKPREEGEEETRGHASHNTKAQHGRVGDHIQLGKCLARAEAMTSSLGGRSSQVGSPRAAICRVRARAGGAHGPKQRGPCRSAGYRQERSSRVSVPRRSNSCISTLAVAEQSSPLNCSAGWRAPSQVCGPLSAARSAELWSVVRAVALLPLRERARVSAPQAWPQTAIAKSSPTLARSSGHHEC